MQITVFESTYLNAQQYCDNDSAADNVPRKKRAWEFADYLSRSRYTTPMANTMCISPMAAHVTFSAISLLHSIVGIS